MSNNEQPNPLFYSLDQIEELCNNVALLKNKPISVEDFKKFLAKSIPELMEEYISMQKEYFKYLYKSEQEERYELSAKIMQTVQTEEANFIELAEYANWLTKELLDDIKAIKTELIKLTHK